MWKHEVAQKRPCVLPDPIWVTVPEAGRLAGVGRSTIYKLLATGALHSIKVGARRLVSFESIGTLGSQDR
jgi:excisionase family DNA binding protein